MIDSIKLYEVIDKLNERTDLVHPAVKEAYGECTVHVSQPSIGRDTASLSIFMTWTSLIRVRYKWFRRVVDILNKCAEGSNMVFIPEIESFECELEDRSKPSGGGVNGSLYVYVCDKATIDAENNQTK